MSVDYSFSPVWEFESALLTTGSVTCRPIYFPNSQTWVAGGNSSSVTYYSEITASFSSNSYPSNPNPVQPVFLAANLNTESFYYGNPNNNVIQLRDLATRNLLASYTIPSGNSGFIEYDPIANVLAVSTTANRLLFLHGSTLAYLSDVSSFGTPNGMVWVAGNQKIYAATNSDSLLKIDAQNQTSEQIYPQPVGGNFTQRIQSAKAIWYDSESQTLFFADEYSIASKIKPLENDVVITQRSQLITNAGLGFYGRQIYYNPTIKRVFILGVQAGGGASYVLVLNSNLQKQYQLDLPGGISIGLAFSGFFFDNAQKMILLPDGNWNPVVGQIPLKARNRVTSNDIESSPFLSDYDDEDLVVLLLTGLRLTGVLTFFQFDAWASFAAHESSQSNIGWIRSANTEGIYSGGLEFFEDGGIEGDFTITIASSNTLTLGTRSTYSERFVISSGATISINQNVSFPNFAINSGAIIDNLSADNVTVEVTAEQAANLTIASPTTGGGTITLQAPQMTVSFSVVFRSTSTPSDYEWRLYEDDSTTGILGTIKLAGNENETDLSLEYSHSLAGTNAIFQIIATGFKESITPFVLSSSDQDFTVFVDSDPNL